jgi:hypothetical protein
MRRADLHSVRRYAKAVSRRRETGALTAMALSGAILPRSGVIAEKYDPLILS